MPVFFSFPFGVSFNGGTMEQARPKFEEIAKSIDSDVRIVINSLQILSDKGFKSFVYDG